MKVSVVMACRNGAQYIETQLEALAAQRWSEPWEVVVADNGSTDDSLRIVERYRARLPELRVVVSTRRRSCAHARNTGARAARGQGIAFCDVDDAVAPGWLAAVGAALEEHEFVACQIESQRLNSPLIQALWKPSLTGPRPHLGYLPAAGGFGINFRRSLYDEIGAFDESLPRLEDIDYSWRVQLAGRPLAFAPAAVVHYRDRDTLAGMYRQARLDGVSQVLLYRKYAARGMPWRSVKGAVAGWVGLVRRIPGVRTPVDRARWLMDLGLHVGRLQGSIRHHTLAL